MPINSNKAIRSKLVKMMEDTDPQFRMTSMILMVILLLDEILPSVDPAALLGYILSLKPQKRRGKPKRERYKRTGITTSISSTHRKGSYYFSLPHSFKQRRGINQR